MFTDNQKSNDITHTIEFRTNATYSARTSAYETTRRTWYTLKQERKGRLSVIFYLKFIPKSPTISPYILDSLYVTAIHVNWWDFHLSLENILEFFR
jgi:uncharacterized membrane protein